MIEIFPNLMQNTADLLASISAKVKLQEVEWNRLLSEESFTEHKEEDYINTDDKIEFFRDELTILNTTLDRYDELIQSVTDFTNLETRLKAIATEYASLYMGLPTLDNYPAVSKKSVDKMKEMHIQKDVEYTNQYAHTVKEFLLNEQYRFETCHDFKELIAHLLPDLFPEDMIIEEEVVGRIKKRLENINEKNRELNSKKIGKIQELLIKVKRQVEAQWDEIRRINRFFTSGSKKYLEHII
ncbi:MAG: hypothetical protein LUE99_04035 [Bacteroides sp.]|nr:hypothetical protein [Tannerellaceae bacterium]MCD8182383.1 hypothetical protein [Bacteroides sp.]